MRDTAPPSSATDDAEAYMVRDVAKKLKLSERYVWELVSAGTIPSFTVGKSRRVSARALREFVEQQERQAAS